MYSPVEYLFKDIFGYLPNKKGAAFERLSAIAMDVIFEGNGEITHDENIRGSISETLYQIDVSARQSADHLVGEAKDYSEQKKKVGRPDIQKLAGALPDLGTATRAAFFSSTGYSKPAEKYAKVSGSLTGGKQIQLYSLQPTVDSDKDGTIQKIVITMHFLIPQMHAAQFRPVITENGKAELLKDLPPNAKEIRYSTELSCFYDKDGKEVLSLHDLTNTGYQGYDAITKEAVGRYALPDKFITMNGRLVEIEALEYVVPHKELIKDLEISNSAEARLTLKDSTGTVLAILSDYHLKKYTFDDNGALRKS